MNRKILITILTILGLAIIAGGFWYYFQSRNNVNLIRNDRKENKEQNQEVSNGKESENQQQEEINIVNKKWSKNSKEVREKFEKYIKEHGKKIELEKVDTIGWKTYTDNKRGFSFQYPSDWHVLSVDSLEDIKDFYSKKHQKAEENILDGYGCDETIKDPAMIKMCAQYFSILCLVDNYTNLPEEVKKSKTINARTNLQKNCNIVFNEYYPTLKSSKKSAGEMWLESILASESKRREYMINNNNIYISLGTLKPWNIKFIIPTGNYIGIGDVNHHGSLIFNTIIQTLKYTN